ncbi:MULTISPECIES: TIGR00341 family protein [unclassified Coleofasciculus]|uniref:TIGR00341 family protein n=1 Tax=unclassified Coleofasciculus TaxID=2692782 RepID=UPI0018812FE1|nr:MULTISPECIES: TIGR00341 family protein [unclassified Coleofasciculus]MBE9127233.1 TIGR00341 family protein [Coleofasciculus sp. LEGE 07081]MBE9150525.1 TIGR00341 family protein [Coleofasciculus sp. LEGE 07092]
MNYRFRKTIVKSKRHIEKFWNQNSGDWHWLSEQPIPIASLNRSLWKAAVPSFQFYFLLGLSAVISVLGLLAGSAATIIGAMIIAPLIGPITGIAYSMVMANRRLLRRSCFTLLTGVLMTVLISMAIAYLIQLRTLSSEIIARVNPTLIDLGVAVAAGAAGAFARSRRSIADALPGVAIAVALVPPLSVIGIGLANRDLNIASGATLLFFTNLIGIIFSGGVVLLFQRYGSIERARSGLAISIVALSLLGLPLGFSLNNLLIKANVRRAVVTLIRNQTLTFSDTDIRSVRVQPQGEALFVQLEVATGLDSISERQVQLVRDFLEQKLEVPIHLNVQVIPVRVFQAPATSGGSTP